MVAVSRLNSNNATKKRHPDLSIIHDYSIYSQLKSPSCTLAHWDTLWITALCIVHSYISRIHLVSGATKQAKQSINIYNHIHICIDLKTLKTDEWWVSYLITGGPLEGPWLHPWELMVDVWNARRLWREPASQRSGCPSVRSAPLGSLGWCNILQTYCKHTGMISYAVRFGSDRYYGIISRGKLSWCVVSGYAAAVCCEVWVANTGVQVGHTQIVNDPRMGKHHWKTLNIFCEDSLFVHYTSLQNLSSQCIPTVLVEFCRKCCNEVNEISFSVS